MLPVIIALAAGGLALATGLERKKAAAKPDKQPKTPDEIYGEGKAAGAAEAEARMKAERDLERRVRKAARHEYLAIRGTERTGLPAGEEPN